MLSKKWVLPAVALVLVGWSLWNVYGSMQDKGKNRVSAAPLPNSPYKDPVSGAGMVEPKSEASSTGLVAVNTELPGVVSAVLRAPHDHVNVGDVLFKLDDTAKLAEKAMKVAALRTAEAKLAKLKQGARPEEVAPYREKLETARASVRMAQDALDRAQRDHVTPPSQLVQLSEGLKMAIHTQDSAEKQLNLVEAGPWAPDIVIAEADVEMAKATLAQVDADLQRLVVKAKVSGEVLEVNVRVGETVTPQPGKALVMLGDTSTLYVRVQIDESEIGRFTRNPNAAASARTRGANPQTVPLSIVRVEPHVVPKTSLTGDNAERVDTRVLQVVYEVGRDSTARIVVGQQLDVYIKADSN
jgi:multidrug resistance efflux pump